MSKHALDTLLTTHIQSFLILSGFSRSRRSFARSRGHLYDRINFQGSRSNSGSASDRFYVNIGVGSQEMDASYLGWNNNRELAQEYVLQKRWEYLVDSAPAEVVIGQDPDREGLPEMILSNLTCALAVINSLKTSSDLARWATEHNGLHCMEKTCNYLLATKDIATLRRYAATLGTRFEHDPRWPQINRSLLTVTESI